MKLVITTWRGTNINDGTNYVADFPEGMPLVNAGQAILVDTLDRPAKTVGRRLSGSYITIFVQPQTNYRAKREELRQLFKTEEEFQYYTLKATDADDSDREWQINLAVLSVTPKDDAFIIVLTPDKPFWSATALNESHSYTTSGQSNNYTAGTPSPYKVKPVLTIEPSTVRTSSYRYEKYLFVKHPGNGNLHMPFDFGNGIDTAALVTAGKMLSTGYDVRLYINGIEVPRWFSGFNTTSTKIWSDVVLPAMSPGYLSTAIAATGGVTEIYIGASPVNKNFFNSFFESWPSQGTVIIGTEAFDYTGRDSVNRKLTGVTRAVKGTSMAAHSVNDVVYVQPFEAKLIYGYSSATDPAYDNSYKPFIDLSTSTNTSHYMTEFNSFLPHNSLTSRWVVSVVGPSGPKAFVDTARYIFTSDGGGDADPWDAIGAQLLSYINGSNAWVADSASIKWIFLGPVNRIASVVINGKKYRTTAAWPVVTVQMGTSNSYMTVMNTVSSPSSAATPQTWSYSSGDISSQGYKYLNFSLIGASSAAENDLIWAEIIDCTINYVSADVPTCFHGTESDSYLYDMVINNTTTGDQISIKKIITLTDTLVIDTVEHRITLNGADSSAGVTFKDKVNWFELQSGVNAITITENGLAGVDLTITGSGTRGV